MVRKKASSSSTTPPSAARTSAAELLDDLLPLAEPSEKELHVGVAVLEVGDPAQLLELAADTGLRPFLLCRLSPTIALVDPGRADDLAEMLRRRGADSQDPQVLNANATMNASIVALPPLLYDPSTRRVSHPVFESDGPQRTAQEGTALDGLRSRAGSPGTRCSPKPCAGARERQERGADRGLRCCRRSGSSAAVYSRYGGSVDGEVIRLDLMARGLLEIVEERTPYYLVKKWKSNPVQIHGRLLGADLRAGLPGLLLLAPLRPGTGAFLRAVQLARRDRPVGQAGGTAVVVDPAGRGRPAAVHRHRAPAAEVALDLSRVLAFLSSHGSVKVRKDGLLSTAVIRAMEKAIPLGKDSDLRLPDPVRFAVRCLAADRCDPGRRG